MSASLRNDILRNNDISSLEKDEASVSARRQLPQLCTRMSKQLKITSKFAAKRTRTSVRMRKQLKIISKFSAKHSKSSVIKHEVSKNRNRKLSKQKTEKKISNESTSMIEKEIAEKDQLANLEKCTICKQYLNNSDIIYYEGHPQDAEEEYTALTDEKLVLVSGEHGNIMERSLTNITSFSIYDEHGHMCAIDGGLVGSDAPIYMSGYLKSICSDSADIDEESVPVKDCGPIIEWFNRGFDGGVKNCIILRTELGEYNLLKPSTEYKPLMENLYERVWLCKVIVEYIKEHHNLQPTYEDLLENIRGHTIPDLDDKNISEEMLNKHAQFVYDQVVNLVADEDNEPLITLPCMKELIKGIKFGKRKFRDKIDFKKVNKKSWSKATTTPLIQKTFENFFTHQLDKTNHEPTLGRKRCGVCEACQLPDCGKCNACRAMCKFGGRGRTKKTCVRRVCRNMTEDSEPEEEDDCQQTSDDDVTENYKKIKWIGEPIKTDATNVYYERVEIDGAKFTVGDYVMIESWKSNIPAQVSRLIYMWKDTKTKTGYFHAEVFIRTSDTVLGEVGDVREVFLGDVCDHDIPLSSILRKASVERRDPPKEWFKMGGKEVNQEFLEDDGKTYFYQKYYDSITARFEDLPVDPECPNILRKHRSCPSCERKMIRFAKLIPRVVGKIENSDLFPEPNLSEWTTVKWRGNDYKKGCGVFLKPGAFKLMNNMNQNTGKKKMKLKKVDEDIYPEYYRKSEQNFRGSNADTRQPFCVAYVIAVGAVGFGPLYAPNKIFLRVNVLYRPENTTSRFPHHEDLNVVYWSDETKEILFSGVVGLCHLVYIDNIPQQDSIQEWLEEDPSRMYFRQTFDKNSGKFGKVPNHAKQVGLGERGKDEDKGKEKGKEKGKKKGKGKSCKSSDSGVTKSQELKVRPLRTLDVFAGCGGLSEGLHRSGVAECKWAIENVEAESHAYSLNNKNCIVFNEDCNTLLKDVLAGATHSTSGLRLPARGEVELLCGGPPCQGFSGMNRFNSRDYSSFKNSLVASYLSFCDYYRPKYFILENVRNFVAFKKGIVLKLTLRALLAMGYQCTFAVLQAGNFGVPQTRRRLFIFAAAPGSRLPVYPESTHVFSKRACSLITIIDGNRFTSNIKRHRSAPRRTCTIQDAMSDLPEICNGANKIQIEYGSMPNTHFQRLARSGDVNAKLRDHICKNMAPLVQARMERIPTTPGSDWRDLPNISVMLSNGTKCKVLEYRYDDKKHGRSKKGALRGVCACAAGGACSPADRQENTLIPWCLPHTANRHNNWAGLYGRITWDGYFSTTVTEPEPMGKQGRVLHPDQHRVVSVRECARSQGFPDTYLFAGTVHDKHRQIGNAVPPPLAAALGREIKKTLSASSD